MSGTAEEFLRERAGRLLEAVAPGVAWELRPGRPPVVEVRAGEPEAARWAGLREPLRALLEAALRFAGLPAGVEVRVPGAGRAEPESEAGELARETRRVAVAAARAGRAFAIGPLSVVERREVHRALADVPGVWTRSEGDGIYRRLWVVPRPPRGAGPGASQQPGEGTPAPMKNEE